VRFAQPGDLRREIFTSLRTAFIFSIIGFSIFLARKAGWLTIYDDFSVRGLSYLAVSLAAMIVAHDAYFYWAHRAMHHPRLFHLFHRTHHQSRTPTPWTAYAFDVPEAIVMLGFVPFWLTFVPMHELGLQAFMTWQIVRNVMGHAGVELSPVSGQPSRLLGWLNTTLHHDLHHQNWQTNYGLYFSWWDRLMGTEHPEYQQRLAAIASRTISAEGIARKAQRALSQTVLGFICAALITVVPGKAQAQSSEILGRWATQGFGSIVDFRPCAGIETAICGRIVWLWQPRDSSGAVRTDVHNPQTMLRTRPLVGIEIVRGLRERSPGQWADGTLYNPDDGRTYTGTISVTDRVLELRGCALAIFCQTQVWRRPEDVVAQARGS
jgi:sterol desaturase/sphingolipid hydroxylase (fatty acid hydroxylase superfamily)/uncharacterized protein (DUF2147 family)